MTDEEIEQKKIDDERAARGEAFEAARIKRRDEEAAALKLKKEENAKRRMKIDFLQANESATEADFDRLFPQIRDAWMLENFRQSKESMTNRAGLEEIKAM